MVNASCTLMMHSLFLPPAARAHRHALLKEDLNDYWGGFKRSKYFDLYARHKSLEIETVHEEDFHQFRVLGVGGFGSVNAAIKKASCCRS